MRKCFEILKVGLIGGAWELSSGGHIMMKGVTEQNLELS